MVYLQGVCHEFSYSFLYVAFRKDCHRKAEEGKEQENNAQKRLHKLFTTQPPHKKVRTQEPAPTHINSTEPSIAYGKGGEEKESLGRLCSNAFKEGPFRSDSS